MITKIDPLKDGISNVELIRAGGTDLDAVNAARVSYGAVSTELTERDKKLIRYLLKHEHTSPFEHTQLVYRIKVPMYITRQWMRHRIGVSYNEISGRYAEIPLDFYIPKNWRIQDPNNTQGSIEAIRDTDEANRQEYLASIEAAKKAYTKLLSEGVCRELARGVLPLCTYTEFIFTCNLVSLFHFVRLRGDSHAQWEIQQYAMSLLKLAYYHFPVSIEHWSEIKGFNLGDIKDKGTNNVEITAPNAEHQV